MEPKLILSLSEWTVVNAFEKLFPKTEGYSIAIPSSRQQKGFDIIVYNLFSKRALTFQIKGSRTYTPDPPVKETTKRYKYYTWFNAFKIRPGHSDYYILFGLFVKTPKDNNSIQLKVKNWYDFILLLLTENDIIDLINNLEFKTKEGTDTKFGFGFDDKEKIFLTRGLKEEKNFSKKLMHYKIGKLKKRLNPKNKKFETKKRANTKV